MGTQKNRHNETVLLSTEIKPKSDVLENINNFTLKNCVYLDYDLSCLYSIQYADMIRLNAQVKLETLQVIAKSHWQHSSLYETMKSSQSEFYANTSLLFQVLCRKHNIYMYSGEYSKKNFDFLWNKIWSQNIPPPPKP